MVLNLNIKYALNGQIFISNFKYLKMFELHNKLAYYQPDFYQFSMHHLNLDIWFHARKFKTNLFSQKKKKK